MQRIKKEVVSFIELLICWLFLSIASIGPKVYPVKEIECKEMSQIHWIEWTVEGNGGDIKPRCLVFASVFAFISDMKHLYRSKHSALGPGCPILLLKCIWPGVAHLGLSH